MEVTRTRAHEPVWMGRSDCCACPIRNRALFAQVPDAALRANGYAIDLLRMRTGGILYEEGASGEYVYALRSGFVKFVQQSGNGNSRIVRLLHAGEVAGLELLTDSTYRHTAMVLRDIDVCRIPLRLLRTLRESNREVCDEILRRLQRFVDTADYGITYLSTGTAQARLARLLLRLAQGKQTDERDWLMREDIAALLGLTLETVSRTVSEFKRQNLVVEHERYFEIHRDRLERIACA
ncbi:MAG: Crp/Fnr family transcriptional regulator [Rhodocyclaceae bacterium]|nr:Crp/Fnr family transcriptional regulator [Rhodocyclaceae bacterium]